MVLQTCAGLRCWGARIRTWEWRLQRPLPYHLATPQRVKRANPWLSRLTMRRYASSRLPQERIPLLSTTNLGMHREERGCSERPYPKNLSQGLR